MDKVQLAYVAGILDGEGHLSITRETCRSCIRGHRHRIMIIVSNTKLQLVQHLKNMFGGYILKTSRPQSYRQKQCYYWKITAVNEQLSFLKLIEPYLFLKRKQAQIMIEFFEGGFTGITGLPLPDEEYQRREKLCQKIQKLNYRGIPLESNCLAAETK